jgi:hypothetical protein
VNIPGRVLVLLGEIVLTWCLTLSCSAADSVDAPLFRIERALNVTLKAPYKEMLSARDKSVRYEGIVVLTDETDLALNAEFRVRGNSRLRRDLCGFPPMSIKFDKTDTAGTVFEGQKKLKLVNSCQPRKPHYEAALLKEFLAYRLLNVMTPRSFQVRLLNVNYQDADTGKEFASHAFLIENKKRMAKRLNVDVLNIEETSAPELDSAHLNLVSLFQLMIGNVDWSATHGHNDECCHNFKLFQQHDAPILAIPYDFDMSGLVNADYAIPEADLGQREITDRRYRGYCRNNTYLAENILRFNQSRDQLMQLVEDLPMAKKEKRRANRYIESFYRIINDPKRVKGVIERWCNKSNFVTPG